MFYLTIKVIKIDKCDNVKNNKYWSYKVMNHADGFGEEDNYD